MFIVTAMSNWNVCDKLKQRCNVRKKNSNAKSKENDQRVRIQPIIWQKIISTISNQIVTVDGVMIETKCLVVSSNLADVQKENINNFVKI